MMGRRNPLPAYVDRIKYWDDQDQSFKYADENEVEFAKAYVESDGIELLDDKQLRKKVHEYLGVKPHHRTGRKKLLAMLERDNEHTRDTEGGNS
jgi:hypothetical protein